MAKLEKNHIYILPCFVPPSHALHIRLWVINILTSHNIGRVPSPSHAHHLHVVKMCTALARQTYCTHGVHTCMIHAHKPRHSGRHTVISARGRLTWEVFWVKIPTKTILLSLGLRAALRPRALRGHLSQIEPSYISWLALFFTCWCKVVLSVSFLRLICYLVLW